MGGASGSGGVGGVGRGGTGGGGVGFGGGGLLLNAIKPMIAPPNTKMAMATIRIRVESRPRIPGTGGGVGVSGGRIGVAVGITGVAIGVCVGVGGAGVGV